MQLKDNQKFGSRYQCEECAQGFDTRLEYHYYDAGDEPCIGRLLPDTTPIEVDRSREWANIAIAVWAAVCTFAIIAALIAGYQDI